MSSYFCIHLGENNMPIFYSDDTISAFIEKAHFKVRVPGFVECHGFRVTRYA